MRDRLRLPAVASLVYWLQAPLYLRYWTDDTYIYAQFARNLARHGELSFNPGEPVHAATSPVWAILGAAGAGLGLEPPLVLKALGALAGFLAVLCFARLATRHLSADWAWLATLAFATQPWFVRWSWSGMETALGALLLVGGLLAGLRKAPRWATLGLLLGLGPLVRPELVLWGGLATGAFLLRGPRPPLRFWLAAALPLLGWVGFAWWQFGQPWPSTLDAKSTPHGLSVGRILYNLKVLAGLVGIAAAVPALSLAAGLRPHRFLRPSWSGSPLEVAAWAWVVALPVVYVVRDVQVVSRYLEIVLPCVLFLGAMVVHRVRGPWARAAWGLQIGVAVVLSVSWVSPGTRAFWRTMDAGLGEIATWLERNTAPDATVAIYDIGVVGYRADRHILDLGGLIHAGINDLRNRHDDVDIVERGLFLEFGTPDYLVHRAPSADALLSAPVGGLRLEPVLDRTVANLGLSRPEPVVYTLYRVHPPSP